MTTDQTTTTVPLDADTYTREVGVLMLAAHLADDRDTLVTITDLARKLWQAAGGYLTDRPACDAVVAVAVGRLSALNAAEMHDA